MEFIPDNPPIDKTPTIPENQVNTCSITEHFTSTFNPDDNLIHGIPDVTEKDEIQTIPCLLGYQQNL